MLTYEEFRLFSELIYQESGIYLKENRKDFLESRLVKRMLATGITSPYWYYKLVSEKKESELLLLLDLLTVNETSLFRNKPQIDLFRNVILPDLTERKQADGDRNLKIWSAGCSTGEEPYTIAMEVCEAVPGCSGWDIRIYASDLSMTALEIAVRGEYTGVKVHATTEDYYIGRYFEKSGDGYRVKDALKKMIVFDFHNLKNDNGLGGLDVIFCRNVMIYFDEQEQRKLVARFWNSLNPGGYLLLGHAESLHGWDTGFQFIYDNKGTAYRKDERQEGNHHLRQKEMK